VNTSVTPIKKLRANQLQLEPNRSDNHRLALPSKELQNMLAPSPETLSRSLDNPTAAKAI